MRLLTPCGLALGFALASPHLAAQPAYLVADLATAPFSDPGMVFMPDSLQELDGVGYFFHDDGTHGMELWRSDGSALGTYLLRDLCPGNCGALSQGSLMNSRAVAGHLFFAANDGVHGVELWVSDGTALGTRLVRDIHPGPASSAPGWMTAAAGQLFFQADDGAHGRELWRSDGTPKGTYLVADLAPGSASLDARTFVEGGGKLFFNVVANGRPENGLWVSDGTPGGSARISSVTSFANALFKGTPFLTLPDGRLLFSGNDSPVTENYELWISDGTAAGTALLSDLNGLPSGSNPTSFVRLGTSIYFTAISAADPSRRTYWKSDGTVVGTVELPSPPGMSAIGYPPSLFAAVGTTLYFAASTPATGVELFRLAGDVASLVSDIRPGAESSIDPFAGFPYSNQVLFAASGNRLLLLADDGVHGVEFWSSDGTDAGTVLLSSITPDTTVPAFDPSLSLRPEPRLGSSLIVRDFDPVAGYRLWRVDAQPESATLIRTLGTHRSSFLPAKMPWFGFVPSGPSCLEAAGSRAVFRTFDPSGWNFPAWGTDGTATGTESLGPATMSSDTSCHSLGGEVLLLTRQSPGVELFRSDGTAAGTPSVTTMLGVGGWGLSEPTFTTHGPLAAFAAEGIVWTTDGITVSNVAPVPDFQPIGLFGATSGHLYIADFELSRYHADVGSPEPVADLNGPDPSYPTDLSELSDGSIVFSAIETAIGRELFVTDGTPENTALVRDIGPGSDSGLEPVTELDLPFESRRQIVALGSRALFAADDGISGSELWVTDGTPLGTYLLKEIYPGESPSTPRSLVHFGDRVVFTAESELEGLELWATDGTTEGTLLVKDIAPGAASSVPDDLVVRDGILYFSAWSPTYGREAWKSDGTTAGTVRITDIAPGPKSSSPQRFARAGNRLFFSATDHVHGYELWAISDDGSIPLFLDGFENESTSRWSAAAP